MERRLDVKEGILCFRGKGSWGVHDEYSQEGSFGGRMSRVP